MPKILKFIKEHKTTVALVAVVMMLLLLYTRTGLCGVSGNSMYPTLRNGDLLLTSRGQDCDRGDIVVLYATELGEDIVKRVIGISGDDVSITQNGLYVNGDLQNESYVSEEDWFKDSAKISVSIPDGYIFVMGDNRSGSYDSRDIGLLPITSVFGTLIWDVSYTIGLSAFGFKVLLAVCLLLLFTFSFLRSKRVTTEQQTMTSIADAITELVNKTESEPEPEPREIVPPAAEKVPPVTLRCGLDADSVNQYWHRKPSNTNDNPLPKE